MVYHTFWLRALATLIDAVVLAPLIIMNFVNESFEWMATSSLLQHAYSVTANALYGQTVGKWIMHVKVVRTHEHFRVTWPHAMLREIYWICISIVMLATEHTSLENYGVGIVLFLVLADALVAGVHPRNRGIHDFIGRTVVIRTN